MRLRQKRERDYETAHAWFLKPLRDFKNDPSWFWLNVLFYAYMIFVAVVLVCLGYDLFFGELSKLMFGDNA